MPLRRRSGRLTAMAEDRLVTSALLGDRPDGRAQTGPGRSAMSGRRMMVAAIYLSYKFFREMVKRTTGVPAEAPLLAALFAVGVLGNALRRLAAPAFRPFRPRRLTAPHVLAAASVPSAPPPPAPRPPARGATTVAPAVAPPAALPPPRTLAAPAPPLPPPPRPPPPLPHPR